MNKKLYFVALIAIFMVSVQTWLIFKNKKKDTPYTGDVENLNHYVGNVVYPTFEYDSDLYTDKVLNVGDTINVSYDDFLGNFVTVEVSNNETLKMVIIK